jgi:Eukaryotic glutathione synthase, ATP binding domain
MYVKYIYESFIASSLSVTSQLLISSFSEVSEHFVTTLLLGDNFAQNSDSLEIMTTTSLLLMPFLLIVASLTPKSYSFTIGMKRLRINSHIHKSDQKLRSLSVMSHDISKPETDRLIKQANAWCALNGLLYSAEDNKFTMAPVALIPNSFSKSAFEYAQNVQPILNELVDILSRDKDFLFEHLASVGESDDFVKRLLGKFGDLE